MADCQVKLWNACLLKAQKQGSLTLATWFYGARVFRPGSKHEGRFQGFVASTIFGALRAEIEIRGKG